MNFFSGKGSLTISRQKRLFELFLQGAVTKLNVRSLPLRMDKFLLIDPLDEGIGRKNIESKLIRSSGIYPKLLPTFNNPLSDFLKSRIVMPMCHYWVTEMGIKRSNDYAITQFFKETYIEENPYFGKSTKVSKKVKVWSIVGGIFGGLGAGIMTMNPVIGFAVGVSIAGGTSASVKVAKAIDRKINGCLQKVITYSGIEGPIQKNRSRL